MKSITILGSTGSIGTQTLDVIRKHPGDFQIMALAAGHNIKALREQITEFDPLFVSVNDERDAVRLRDAFPKLDVISGVMGLDMAATFGADITVNAMSGVKGLKPTLEAIAIKSDIALANKETLVAGGELVMRAAAKNGVRILPVDSEHSAIFQCLEGSAGNTVKRIILTASGGPFRGYTAEQLESVTLDQALRHPNWSMGPKITVDSATMMNKGLEIIEASWLFGVDADKIEVVIHPQSIIHSAVEFEDGAILAQMGLPDMRVPIAYALSRPVRLQNVGKSVDFFELGSLSFERPDTSVFKCLALAYEAIRLGKDYPVVLNAANEEANIAFRRGFIKFTQIPSIIDKCLQSHNGRPVDSYSDVTETDWQTRIKARDYIQEITKKC